MRKIVENGTIVKSEEGKYFIKMDQSMRICTVKYTTVSSVMTIHIRTEVGSKKVGKNKEGNERK